MKKPAEKSQWRQREVLPPGYTTLSGLWSLLPVLGSDVGHDVLIEELQDQRDAVGKYQVLGHVLKLVDVVQFEVLEQQQQHSRNGLNDDLFVAVHIHPQLHALQHCGGHLLRQDICQDVDGVCFGF